jgi:Ca2+-binding EF-hand superfamily protein
VFCVVADIVDPNRDGYVSLQEYMAFMISKETENVQSSEEIENAFRAITAGDRPYVTKEELYAVSKIACPVIYLPKLKQKISFTAVIIHPQHCHFMNTYN